MRIDPDDRIAGYPVLAIRTLLRKRVFKPAVVEKVLKVDGKEAGRVIEALRKEGYVCAIFGDNPPPDTVQTTPKGSMLASAHARPSISREEAERLMDEFMTRIGRARDDDRFLYEARQVIVFGSYLSDADELNDIDLIVKVRVKGKFKDTYEEVLRDRLDAAQAIGLPLKRDVDWRPYPRRGLLGYLRGVSRYLSFHRVNEMEIIAASDRRRGVLNPGTPHEVIYQADD